MIGRPNFLSSLAIEAPSGVGVGHQRRLNTASLCYFFQV